MLDFYVGRFPGDSATSPLRNFIFWLSTKKKVTDAIARRGMKHGFMRRFVAGATLAEAMPAVTALAISGRRVILNHLGENVSTPEEAAHARDSYIEMLKALEGVSANGNVAIKLTQLGLDFDREQCAAFAQEIAAAAAGMGRTIEIDMESSRYTDATLEIYEAVHRRYGNAGVALQAALRRTEADLERLIPLAPKVRLVKGAYHEPPAIAFQQKSEVDANYAKLLDRLLEARGKNRCFAAIATHDPVLVDRARAKVEQLKLGEDAYEFQMLLGIRRDLQAKVSAQGHPLRIYVPFGTAWCPYFMRRLSERPANLWFVLRSLLAERNK